MDMEFLELNFSPKRKKYNVPAFGCPACGNSEVVLSKEINGLYTYGCGYSRGSHGGTECKNRLWLRNTNDG
jgi:hypothetical protein